MLWTFWLTAKAYGDLTGRFPYQSSCGNQYFLVVYNYDSNAILVELLKYRNGTKIKNPYLAIINRLTTHGCAPSTFILDNEVSTNLLTTFRNKNIHFQLVPPEVHRRNAAECAIQTWKNHFIAGLSSTDPSFPMSEWDRLVQQGELTLNLLHNTRVNPKLSAWAYLFGQFNYNAAPLASPGAIVIVHVKPHKRASWDPHSVLGYYSGPALNHYRCYTCYIPKTKSECVTDTMSYLSWNIPIPDFTPRDHLWQALNDIITILRRPHKTLPFLTASDNSTNAIRLVAEILNHSSAAPSQMDDRLDPHIIEKILQQYKKKLIRNFDS